MASQILCVTSFPERMYAQSARLLLESYVEAGQPNRFLICYEGAKPPLDHPLFDYHDLGLDKFLLDWLGANRDVIPVGDGGTLSECECRDRHKRHGRHAKGCPWSFMNRSAHRFFRKVASFRVGKGVAERLGLRYMLWVDADCRWKKAMPDRYFIEKLNGSGLFYFRGHRPAVESGILGFDLRGDGSAIIKALCRLYSSRAYRGYERWDDGAVLAKVLDTKAYKARDLVHPRRHDPKSNRHHGTNHVVRTTDVTRYVDHDKGFHTKNLNLDW